MSDNSYKTQDIKMCVTVSYWIEEEKVSPRIYVSLSAEHTRNQFPGSLFYRRMSNTALAILLILNPLKTSPKYTWVRVYMGNVCYSKIKSSSTG